MSKVSRDRLELEGEVVDCSNGKFLVKINDTYSVLCTLSGKIRQNAVKILCGDLVRVEAGTYDPTQGRIVYRTRS